MGRSQGLQRALIVLALAGLACKATPEREPPGEAPRFHDQLLYDGAIDPGVESEQMPALPGEHDAGWGGPLAPAKLGDRDVAIDEGGRIARVEDRTGEGFADHEVSRCVVRAIRRWRFPRPQAGGSTTVRYPIRLTPGE